MGDGPKPFALGNRCLFVQAVVMLPLIGLWLRLLGLRRTMALLRGWARPAGRPEAHEEMGHAEAIARVIGLAVRHTFGQPRCLQQSLTLWWALRRHGLDASLCLGVRKVDGKVEGHAWVEFRGQVLNDDIGFCRSFAPLGAVTIG